MNQNLKATYLDSINLILNQKETWRLVNNMNSVLKHLEKISEINLQIASSFDLLNKEKKSKFIRILIEFLNSSYEVIKQNICKSNLIISSEIEALRIAALFQLSCIIWHWSDDSNEFCIRMHNQNGLECIFKFINDNTFIFHLIEKLKQLNSSKQAESKMKKYAHIYKNLLLFFKSLVGCIHNLSKFEHLNKSRWQEVNAMSNLFKVVTLCFDELSSVDLMDIDLLAYFALVRIAKKKSDLDFLDDKYLIDITVLIKECGAKLALVGSNVERREYKFSDHLNMEKVLVISSKENTKWRLTELIEILVKLGDLNEKYKHEIFEMCVMSLKHILFNGNEVEKEYVLKLLWRFCFNADLLDEIRHDSTLCSFIVGLSINNLLSNQNVFKYCDLILYFLNGNKFKISTHLYEPHKNNQVY
jgi:hypothetical protein